METTKSQNPAICAYCDATLDVPADPKLVSILPVWPERNLGYTVPWSLCPTHRIKLAELLRRVDLSEATAFAVKCHGNVRSLYAYLPPSLVALMADE